MGKPVVSPPLSVGPEFLLELSELPGDLVEAAKEAVSHGAGAWASNMIVVGNLGAAKPDGLGEMVKLGSDGVHHFKPGATSIGKAPFDCEVLRIDPHHQPIVWRIKGAPGEGQLATVQPKPTKNKLELYSRLRMSMWAAPENCLGSVAGARGIIDDVSLLNTLSTGLLTSSGELSTIASTGQGQRFRVDFDPLKWGPVRKNAPVGVEMSDATKFGAQKTNYLQVIKECHAAGVQVLAGLALVNGNTGRGPFNQWVKRLSASAFDKARRTAELTQLSDDIIGFLRLHFPSSQSAGATAFDGISFDIECVGEEFRAKGHPTSAELDDLRRRADVMTEFYHAVAQRFAGEDKIVGIACAGLNEKDYIVPVAGKTRIADPTGVTHPFEMALGAPNIIMRPMAYDSGTSDAASGGGGVSPTWDWHDRILRYALEGAKLHPSQFQLGVKNVLRLNGGEVPDASRRAARCKDLLRPSRIGYIEFALGKLEDPRAPRERLWDGPKGCNLALNPDPANAGKAIPTNRKGQPLHVPLGESQAASLRSG